MRHLLKIIPSLILWSIFIYVVFKIPYPETITQANLIQLFAFFIPLFLSLALTINIFLKNIFISTSVSLGLVFLLFLKALGSLNIVSGVLSLIPIGLLISYFGKRKNKGLTNYPKIPKLHAIRRRK